MSEAETNLSIISEQHMQPRELQMVDNTREKGEESKSDKSAENALRYKIAAAIVKSGMELDDSFLAEIMSDHNTAVRNQYGEGMFHRLFWDQQQKALEKSPTQRLWHPMLIRWCLHLRMMSPAALQFYAWCSQTSLWTNTSRLH
jgi:hypothetical protein